MKIYVYILLLSLALYSCRSNRNIHRNVDTASQEDKRTQSVSSKNSNSQTTTETSKQTTSQTNVDTDIESRDNQDKITNQYEKETETTTYFNPDGSVRAIRTREREFGKSESESNRSGSDIKSRHSNENLLVENTNQETNITNEQTDSTLIDETNVSSLNENTQEESTTDSRPIQGSEWLYIAIGIAGVIIVIVIIVIKKYGRKGLFK